jgi:DNA-directed RNA polymerase subunit M/transcription elongation factor TFIIS
MPIAHRVDEPCENCGDDSNVWVHEKPEGSVTKLQYACESCGAEWTEIA